MECDLVLVPGDEPVSSGNERFRHEDSPIQWVPSESPLTSMVVNKVPPSSQEFIHPRSEVQHGEESDQMQFMWWDYRYLF